MPKSRKRQPKKGTSQVSTVAAAAGSKASGGAKAANAKVSPIKFVAQTRQEGRKVTWTSWKETLTTTILVLIMVVLFGLFFFVVDWILGTGTKAFLEFFTSGSAGSGPLG